MRPGSPTSAAFAAAALAVGVALIPSSATTAATGASDRYVGDLEAWRAKADASLRKDRGWLTLVGRHVLRYGANTVGSAPGNDVVLDAAIAPPRLGTIHVDERRVKLVLAGGVAMHPAEAPARRFTGERALGTEPGRADWVAEGRLAFQVIRRDDGQAVLRVADNAAPTRAAFPGRLWYEPQRAMALPATFVPAAKGERITIVNVLNEISREPAAGSVEFTLDGRPLRLDAVDDDGNLFIIFRDGTAADATYPPGRFLYLEKPKDGKWVVDFNRAYNPPCAFSAYTSCPLPPPQNVLAPRIEAGERYRGR